LQQESKILYLNVMGLFMQKVFSSRTKPYFWKKNNRRWFLLMVKVVQIKHDIIVR